MTLREYIEKQIDYFSEAKKEAKLEDPMYSIFEGRVRAYDDILQTCSNSVLDSKILDEVW